MTARRSTIRPAFTLLEVILAVGLVLILVAAVYAFYHHTLAVRDTCRREADTLFAQRRILDRLAGDLRCGVDVGLQFGFRGSGEEVSFLRAVMPSPAVFYTPSATRRRADDEQAGEAFEIRHDVELIRYFLEPGEEADEIGPLKRDRLNVLRTGGVQEEQDVESVVLSRKIKFLYLEYLVGEEWSASWDRKGLPAAVRITLGAQPLPEGTDPKEYPYEKLWREVAIPAGGGDPAGAAPRQRRTRR